MRQEILKHYTGGFEIVGSLFIDQNVRPTDIRFRNKYDFENFISSIDDGFDSSDAISNGCIYKLNTLQVNLVNSSPYGNGCDFKPEIVEKQGIICFVPRNVSFFKCINFLTAKDYKQQILDSIRNEKKNAVVL